MTLLADFDVPRSKTRNTYKPRGWEERVELENKLLQKLGKIKTEPLEDVDFNQDEEEAGPSNHAVKKTVRIFTDENDDDRSDSIFDSDDDFEKPKQNKRKLDSKDNFPPPKKSKLNNNVKNPKPKSKPKGLSISRQIVK